jgi:uncharacterized protein YcbK (DUF882 family)
MSLSQHFTLAELTRTRTGLANNPSAVHVENLTALCVELLEPLRAALGQPVRITSGYRSKAVNGAVRGSSTSAHTLGLAADLKSIAGDAEHILRVLHGLDLPELDQAIGYDATRGGHVHVGLARPGMMPRRQYLWAPEEGGYQSWRP